MLIQQQEEMILSVMPPALLLYFFNSNVSYLMVLLFAYWDLNFDRNFQGICR